MEKSLNLGDGFEALVLMKSVIKLQSVIKFPLSSVRHRLQKNKTKGQ